MHPGRSTWRIGLALALAGAVPALAGDRSAALTVSATLRAYIPVELALPHARAVITGPLPGGRVYTSAHGPAACLRFTGLTPGRYRLMALEGAVNTTTARLRFLYPHPDDGYRVLNPRLGGGFQTYRVLVPRRPEFEVEVAGGRPAWLDGVEVRRRAHRTWGVQVVRTPGAAPADEAQTCQASGSSAAGRGRTTSSRAGPPSGT